MRGVDEASALRHASGGAAGYMPRTGAGQRRFSYLWTSVHERTELARRQCGMGAVVGTHVDSPAPTIRKPTSATSCLVTSVVGSYCQTLDVVSPV